MYWWGEKDSFPQPRRFGRAYLFITDPLQLVSFLSCRLIISRTSHLKKTHESFHHKELHPFQ